MATVAINPIDQAHELRQQAHEFIDRLAVDQLSVVVGLFRVIVDPRSGDRANIAFEDESPSEGEEAAAKESKKWLKTNQPISNEEVLAEFGLTSEDFEQMGRTPLEPCLSGL